MRARIDLDSGRVADFCRRHHVRRLSLFGSVTREDFGEESDVDVLVEFEPGARVGLFQLVEMEEELSRLAGRRVDLRTPAELSRYFRDQVVAAAEPLFAG
ncbi:nucleotidyltransferase family protein [Acidobacteria bacterium ACD]|nr:MAG: nucleotidyltransferase [Acidobacteriota bacterium]MCE7957803.1 nucleotidyltransferase [Acidobacteria bacterium ACB2]MDL1948803.1 nucleotidyltransferase family protein [Acidobacteria bacterium ACD]